MKVLVIGANGFLGLKILKYSSQFAPNDEFIGADIDISLIPDNFLSYPLDISDARQVEDTLNKINPDLTILTAAMTNVDQCEDFKDKAHSINALGPKHVSIVVKKRDKRLIFISTDFVFDGAKGWYVEEDQVNPISYYGESKLEGERFVINSRAKSLICRTSVLYGWPVKGQRDNFFSWAKEKLYNGEKLKITSSQKNCPTLCDDLAKSIIKLRNFSKSYILHTCGSERISRYEFVNKIAENFDYNKKLIESVQFFEQKAERPNDSSMSNEKIAKLFGIEFNNVTDSMKFLLHGNSK